MSNPAPPNSLLGITLITSMPLVLSCALMLAAPVVARVQKAPPDSWLSRQPLKGWNAPGALIPEPPSGQNEDRASLLQRCKLAVSRGTPAESAIADGGWIPFRLFDREIVGDEVEILGGMAGADGMCRPAPYNAFVFVEGRFAGTLSPSPMTSRQDASMGAVRLLEAGLVSAEFVRYTEDDPLCCPSSRVTVRYRIDRSGSRAVVVPIDVRQTR